MQNASAGAVALGILTVFLGSGSVQLLIFLFRRRSELKEMDAKAGAVSLDASNNLITRLQLESEKLNQQILHIRADQLRETEESARRLTLAHEENARLQREVAILRTDLGIAQRQLDQLRPSDPGPYYGQHRSHRDL